MNSLLERLRRQISEHLSDSETLLLLSGELAQPRKQAAEQHLEGCLKCRTRYENFMRAERRVARYSDHCAELPLRRPGTRRHALEVEIARLLREEAPSYDVTSQQRKAPSKRRLIRFPLFAMSPTLAIGMACALVSIVCVFAWLQDTRPRITSNALLVRAEAWDSGAATHTASGVIYQTIKITMPDRAVERSIYRDVQGRRKIKAQKLPLDQQQLKAKLATAGVAWDAPLSATNYQAWHDRQRVRQDQIARSGPHLLVLTTTTPEGDVAAQSLTVRDTDFHPVDRTISFRDQETVEIAEVDYQVLPWSAATADMFEPLGGIGSESVHRVPVLPALHLPTLLSETQLDETELSVRLALNDLHADTGEQINVERTPLGIEVKGLVEDDQRRRQLESQLEIIPHVTASIRSIEDLERAAGAQSSTTGAEVDSVSVNPSPLETYFVAQGRDATALRTLSQQLVSSALAATQESRSIADLTNRFSSDAAMTDVAKATLAELIFAHREKLSAALDEEQRLLSQLVASGGGGSAQAPQSAGTRSLVSAADRNLALCEELALGSSSQPRTAEEIFPELTVSLNALRADARQAQNGAQKATAGNEQK